MTWARERKESLLFLASVALLMAGVVAWRADAATTAEILWTVGTVLGLAASIGWTVSALRRRQPSVDVIAVLALVGALAVDDGPAPGGRRRRRRRRRSCAPPIGSRCCSSP